jgi:hypothetical protein
LCKKAKKQNLPSEEREKENEKEKEYKSFEKSMFEGRTNFLYGLDSN